MRLSTVLGRAAIAVAGGIALVVVMAPAANAEPVAPSGGTVTLSPDDRARFIAGAQSVGGLTPDQVDQALADPDLLAGVPVELVAESGLPDAETASTGCLDPYVYVDALNVTHSRLWRFQMSKYFCWNGTSVTRGDAAIVSTAITTLGTTTGWKWAGMDSQFDRFYQLGASAHGGHHSYRRGHFQFCPPRLICFQDKYPTLNIWGHHDGSYDYSYAL